MKSSEVGPWRCCAQARLAVVASSASRAVSQMLPIASYVIVAVV